MKTIEKITILMYHRVDGIDTDPWGICVAPDLFAEQIQYLSNRHRILSIDEAVQQLASGSIAKPGVCITFDDGYADNYVYAKPVLEQYHCPATFFIPTAFIGAKQPFWWDELEYIFLHLPTLPQQLQLTVNNQLLCFTIKDTTLTNQQWRRHQSWKWYDGPPTDRCSVFLVVWEALRPLPNSAIQQHLTTIRSWAGSGAPKDFRPPMNHQQLKLLLSNKLFTAGLHTHTHTDLAAREKKSQQDEVEQCNTILHNEFGISSSWLAYPYGRSNTATLKVAKDLQLQACFTTESNPVFADSDMHTLGRYQVCNWNANELHRTLGL